MCPSFATYFAPGYQICHIIVEKVLYFLSWLPVETKLNKYTRFLLGFMVTWTMKTMQQQILRAPKYRQTTPSSIKAMLYIWVSKKYLIVLKIIQNILYNIYIWSKYHIGRKLFGLKMKESIFDWKYSFILRYILLIEQSSANHFPPGALWATCASSWLTHLGEIFSTSHFLSLRKRK